METFLVAVVGAAIGFGVDWLMLLVFIDRVGIWVLALSAVAGGAIAVAIDQAIRLRKMRKFFNEFVSQFRVEFEGFVDKQLSQDASYTQGRSQAVVDFQQGGLHSTDIDPALYKDADGCERAFEMEHQRRQLVFRNAQTRFYYLYDLASFVSGKWCYLNLRVRKYGQYLKPREETPVTSESAQSAEAK